MDEKDLEKGIIKNGYVRLWRKIQTKGWYKNSKYVHLWIHILLKANHKPNEFMWNGKIIIIKEGQLITGRKQLARETGLKQSTIEDILKMFENEHQIRQQKTNKFRLITVINWKGYQSQPTALPTTEQQQSDTNNNDNNDNNILETDKSVSVADSFSLTAYIAGMRAPASPPHIRLIGWYFEHRGAEFPDVETIRAEIKRWVKDAKFIAKYDNKKIAATLKLVKKKFPDDWKLSTIRKYISD